MLKSQSKNFLLDAEQLSCKDFDKASKYNNTYRQKCTKQRLPEVTQLGNDQSIKTAIILQYNHFFNVKIKDNAVKLTKNKTKKVEFFTHYILKNKCFFVDLNKGVQLCTTSIGKKLGVSPETVMNWIKKLIALGELQCTNTAWSVSKYARKYKINNLALVLLMNNCNGYSEEHGLDEQQSLKSIMNQMIRIKEVNQVDKEMPTMRQFCNVAQQFLNQPLKYLEAIKRRCSKNVLLRPSDQKHVKSLETFLGTAIRAYNYVASKNRKRTGRKIRKIGYKLLKQVRKLFRNPLFFRSRKQMTRFYDKKFSILTQYYDCLRRSHLRSNVKNQPKSFWSRIIKMKNKLRYTRLKKLKTKGEFSMDYFIGKARVIPNKYCWALDH